MHIRGEHGIKLAKRTRAERRTRAPGRESAVPQPVCLHWELYKERYPELSVIGIIDPRSFKML